MKPATKRKSIVRVFNSFVLTGIVIGLAIFSVVIGVYNYDTSLNDLRNKTSNFADLASISLKEPVWNYDGDALQSIFTAILLDPDVVAIRVLSETEEKTTAEKKRDNVQSIEFDQLLKNSHYINNTAKISRENKTIARVQLVASTERVRAAIRNTTILISIFSLAFLGIISGFIWYLGVRVLARPINTLRESADHLADGNLDEVIQTGRNDEIGSLAVSFDKMRNAIRKRLADLAILNSTGEKLAGIHDQVLALETAIEVMSKQTNVERGSIYLLDSNKQLKLNAFFPKMDDHSAQFPKEFRLDEGIVGKVAATAKIHFLPDVSKEPDYVGGSSGEGPKALLCVPMMDDQEVFGVMNFVGEVGKVSFSEEDEGFALTIARTVVVTIKNIQMLAVIEEHNRTLEQKIQERTSELRQKTNDVNNMLQNMQQGIFTVLAGQTIHPEYSAYLSEIFEVKDVANRPALSFLFDQSNIGSDVLSQMSAALDSMIGEDSMMYELNSHLLVQEYTKYFDGGRSKIIELDWNSVLNSEDIIDKVMVTARDVTELKALQLETEKQKEELDVIGQILAVSRDKFLEFVSTSFAFLDENKALIEANQDKNSDVIATLFRNMHTIKGNARTYGLSYITDRVHEAETTYSQLRLEDEAIWDQGLLLEQLQSARDCVARYESVFKEKLASFSGGDSDSVKQALEKIAEAVDGVNELTQLPTLKHSLLTVKSSIDLVRSEDIDGMMKGILSSVPSLAKQLEKEPPVVNISELPIRIKNEIVPVLRNVFMHVFRNSIDHGLETAEQRTALGKPAQGAIKLDVALSGDNLMFTYEDDGKGLALERIYKKALADGVVSADQPMTDEQIAELIFLSGLSTAEVVSTVSGRGVGMDAIKKFLNKHQGDIQLVFTGESTTPGFRPFKQIITVPAKFAVQSSQQNN